MATEQSNLNAEIRTLLNRKSLGYYALVNGRD
jgi:hypothetical protein